MHDGPRDPEVSALIRHSRDLRENAPRIGERLVDVPQRTRAPDPGEMKIRRRLTFRDVACTIDPDEEEWNAACGWPLQGAEAMADGFEPNAEFLAKQFDVMSMRFCSG